MLKLEGRSGCKLEVLSNDGIPFVRKYSKDEAYNKRLLLQAQKQHVFSQAKLYEGFTAPQILSRSDENERNTWFDMQYIHGQKYSEFLERASIIDIKLLANRFIAYFKQQFEFATVENVDKNLFIDKAEAIKVLLVNRSDLDHDLLHKVFYFLKQIPADSIPIFPCHGDFTLSNMLFDKTQIYLVDFLDSFVESPIIDLVKLRQDTFFYWSLSIEKNMSEARSSKVVQILRHLDQEIVDVFRNNVFFIEWYRYLQVFNLIRILPYVHQATEIQFVQRGVSLVLTS